MDFWLCYLFPNKSSYFFLHLLHLSPVLGKAPSRQLSVTVLCLLKSHCLIRAPPSGFGTTTDKTYTVTKIDPIFLIPDRFSIRNHRWKA